MLGKVKDYSRRRKLDSSAKENMQGGGDPMDVGAVGGWSWYDDVEGGCDHEGVSAVGFEGKGKSKDKGKEDCYNCGSPDRFSRKCPDPHKGKSKGKGRNRSSRTRVPEGPRRRKVKRKRRRLQRER